MEGTTQAVNPNSYTALRQAQLTEMELPRRGRDRARLTGMDSPRAKHRSGQDRAASRKLRLGFDPLMIDTDSELLSCSESPTLRNGDDDDDGNNGDSVDFEDGDSQGDLTLQYSRQSSSTKQEPICLQTPPKPKNRNINLYQNRDEAQQVIASLSRCVIADTKQKQIRWSEPALVVSSPTTISKKVSHRVAFQGSPTLDTEKHTRSPLKIQSSLARAARRYEEDMEPTSIASLSREESGNSLR